MSISELNHFMTYVLEGWMLLSGGFVGIGFISFLSKRIQEDLEAEAAKLAQAEEQAITQASTEVDPDSARLEEVAAVSEQLAKNKGKQSSTSSVSVSTQ